MELRSQQKKLQKPIDKTAPCAKFEDIPSRSGYYFVKISQSETTRTSSKTNLHYKFGFSSHAYAPIDTQDAIYLPIDAKDFKDYLTRTLVPDTANKSYYYPEKWSKDTHYETVFVPLQYIRAVAASKVKSGNGKHLSAVLDTTPDQVGPNDQDEIPKIVNSYDAVLPKIDENFNFSNPAEKLVDQEWKKRVSKRPAEVTKYQYPYGLKSCQVVPFRNEKGALFWGHYAHTSKDAVLAIWKVLWENRARSLSTSRAGYSMRYEKFPMKKPLAIIMSNDALKIFEKPEEVFRSIIEHIASQEQYKDQLKFFQDLNGNKDYVFLSENPFRLYKTYIHTDCVDDYMKYLTHSELDKAATDTVTEVNEEVITADGQVEEKEQPDEEDEDITKALKPNAQPGTKTENTDPVRKLPDDNSFETEMVALLTGGKNKANSLDSEGSITQGTMDQEDDDDKPSKLKKHYKKKPKPSDDWTSSSVAVPLSWDKISAAIGTRKDSTVNKTTQGSSMGFGAGLMAECALGWDFYQNEKRRRMKNGLYIAEWLHLCAYSWGGIDPNTQKKTDRMSEMQDPKNLVFGSSEANSCMTRYEKSWQKLFEDEFKYFNSNITGDLTAMRNPKQGTMRIDKHEEAENRYHWTEHEDWINKPDQEHKRELAIRFPSLAYSIGYSITLRQSKSKILGSFQKDAYNFTFYPFSRRFFHKSESILDRALYQYMFYLALKQHHSSKVDELFHKKFQSLIIPQVLVQDINMKQITDKGLGSGNKKKFDNFVQIGLANQLTKSLDLKNIDNNPISGDGILFPSTDANGSGNVDPEDVMGSDSPQFNQAFAPTNSDALLNGEEALRGDFASFVEPDQVIQTFEFGKGTQNNDRVDEEHPPRNPDDSADAEQYEEINKKFKT